MEGGQFLTGVDTRGAFVSRSLYLGSSKDSARLGMLGPNDSVVVVDAVLMLDFGGLVIQGS